MVIADYKSKTSLRGVLKKLGTLILGPYRVNRIYRFSGPRVPSSVPPGITLTSVDDIHSAAPPASVFIGRSSYRGFDSHGFGLFKDGELACLCWFWGSNRFDDPQLWKLKEGEAILVDLLTAPEFRRQGLATILINYASDQMLSRGYSELYTWMWHTHHASSRSFEKAGWKPVAIVAEIYPFHRRRAIRFQRLVVQENGTPSTRAEIS